MLPALAECRSCSFTTGAGARRRSHASAQRLALARVGERERPPPSPQKPRPILSEYPGTFAMLASTPTLRT
jgi:hypothetical protein